MKGPLHGMPREKKRMIRAKCRPLFDRLMKMKGSHIMMLVIADPKAPTDKAQIAVIEGPTPEHINNLVDGTTAVFAKTEPDGLDRLCAYMTWFLGRDIQHHRRAMLHSLDCEVRHVWPSTIPSNDIH